MSENQDKRNAVGRLRSAGAVVGPVPPPGIPVRPPDADAGRVPSHGESSAPTKAASGDAAYNKPADVGPVLPRGVPVRPLGADVGRVPSHGAPVPLPDEPPPHRLRRLHRVWPDRDGNI